MEEGGHKQTEGLIVLIPAGGLQLFNNNINTSNRIWAIPTQLFRHLLCVHFPHDGAGSVFGGSVLPALSSSAMELGLSQLFILSQILGRRRVNETRAASCTASSPAVWLLHVIMHTASFQVCPPQSYTENWKSTEMLCAAEY